jgi:hypothetical protein
MNTMRKKAMLIAAWVVAMPCAHAGELSGKPPMAAEHGGHDHAAMGGMGRAASWTGYPMLKSRMSGENREQMVITAVPQNIVPHTIDAYSNNVKDENAHRQLPLEMAGAKLDKPASGGFHWLSAREEQGDKVLVASTVHSFGGGGAKDPTAMFMQQKHELEIIPQPYPREHSRYRADENWKFLLRFNGAPLPSQKLVLETQNGTRAEWMSDAQGIVTVHLPDDFKAEEEQKAGEHRRGMPPGSEFVLATEHAAGGKSYLTAFNGSYGRNAFDKRSLAMGLGFTLLGMLGAVPLLRKRKTEPKSEETENA